jgi:hypothetical protein
LKHGCSSRISEMRAEGSAKVAKCLGVGQLDRKRTSRCEASHFHAPMSTQIGEVHVSPEQSHLSSEKRNNPPGSNNLHPIVKMSRRTIF